MIAGMTQPQTRSFAQSRSFQQVDVFSADPLRGNPVAVVLDGTDLDPDLMARFANWTNLSETTFVGPPSHPQADYLVRIFTTEEELPFAGHPTLGSAHAWLAAGGQPKGPEIIQECAAGLIRIRRNPGGELAFAAPPRRRSGPLAPGELADAVACLGAAPEVVAHSWGDNGPPWQILMLDNAQAVLDLDPDPHLLGGRFLAAVGPQPPGSGTDYEVRAFFPAGAGMAEDPVTGSLAASLGQWLLEAGMANSPVRLAQGTRLGRRGRVRVSELDGQVWVGGQATTIMSGTVAL